MMVEPGVSTVCLDAPSKCDDQVVRQDAPCEIEELLWLTECLTLRDLVNECSEAVLLILDLRNDLFHSLPV